MPDIEIPESLIRDIVQSPLPAEQFIEYEDSDRDWLEGLGFIPSLSEALREYNRRARERIAREFSWCDWNDEL